MSRLAILTIALLFSLQVHAGTVVLENDNLKVVFNKQNGAIEQLISKSSGWRIEDRPQLALSFYMNIPLPGQRQNPVSGTRQNDVECIINDKEKKVTFIWNNIISEKGGELDVIFKGTAQLKHEGLTFAGEIINNSPYVVEIIRWPQLGDLTIPDMNQSFSQMGIYYGGMNKFDLYPKFQNEPGYFAVDNPQNWMEFPYTPFVLLGSEKEGLYVGYHDTTARDLLQFKAELKPGYESYELWDTGVNPQTDSIVGKAVRYEFYTTHFPFVLPQESTTLNPVVLQPYGGSWHKGADMYKAWRSTWFKAPHAPKWIKEVHSWQQIHMNNPEDDIRYTYKDLLKIGKDCVENGVEAIQVTGWTKGGQDRDNPSHDTDPRLGTAQELKEVISEIQKSGVRIILFAKFTWADRSTEWYENELIKYGMKDPYGDPYYYNGYAYQTDVQLAEINTHHFTPMCHLSSEWRKIADNEFSKTIDLGADGMLFDENQHHGGAKYCYNGSHGHKVPAYIFAGDEILAEGFEKIKNRRNPDYVFAGEGNYDLEFRQYQLSYFRVNLDHIPLHRYVAPEEEMMIAVSGYNDRNMINTALLYRYIISYEPRNFKGRLQEYPMTLAYGKKVDALRKRYHHFLWDGTFRHIIGADVTVGGEPYDKYAVFVDKTTGKRAVVIANFSYEKPIDTKLTFDDSDRPMLLATPEKPDPVSFNGKAVVPPNSAIVVFEE